MYSLPSLAEVAVLDARAAFHRRIADDPSKKKKGRDTKSVGPLVSDKWTAAAVLSLQFLETCATLLCLTSKGLVNMDISSIEEGRAKPGEEILARIVAVEGKGLHHAIIDPSEVEVPSSFAVCNGGGLCLTGDKKGFLRASKGVTYTGLAASCPLGIELQKFIAHETREITSIAVSTDGCTAISLSRGSAIVAWAVQPPAFREAHSTADRFLSEGERERDLERTQVSSQEEGFGKLRNEEAKSRLLDGLTGRRDDKAQTQLGRVVAPVISPEAIVTVDQEREEEVTTIEWAAFSEKERTEPLSTAAFSADSLNSTAVREFPEGGPVDRRSESFTTFEGETGGRMQMISLSSNVPSGTEEFVAEKGVKEHFSSTAAETVKFVGGTWAQFALSPTRKVVPVSDPLGFSETSSTEEGREAQAGSILQELRQLERVEEAAKTVAEKIRAVEHYHLGLYSELELTKTPKRICWNAGKSLFCYVTNNAVIIEDLSTSRQIRIPPPQLPSLRFSDAALSSDGTVLAVSTDVSDIGREEARTGGVAAVQGTPVYLYDLQSLAGAPVPFGRLLFHSEGVADLAFSPDGLLASVGKGSDHSLLLWRPSSAGREREELPIASADLGEERLRSRALCWGRRLPSFDEGVGDALELVSVGSSVVFWLVSPMPDDPSLYHLRCHVSPLPPTLRSAINSRLSPSLSAAERFAAMEAPLTAAHAVATADDGRQGSLLAVGSIGGIVALWASSREGAGCKTWIAVGEGPLTGVQLSDDGSAFTAAASRPTLSRWTLSGEERKGKEGEESEGRWTADREGEFDLGGRALTAVLDRTATEGVSRNR